MSRTIRLPLQSVRRPVVVAAVPVVAPRVDPPRAYRVMAWSAIAGGAALRAWGLGRFPLEQDELYTVMESRDLWRTALAPGIDARPLYYLAQHPLLALLPDTAAALRVMPFVFGVAGIWAVWRLGLRVAGPAAGAVAAVLVAMSPWHMHASGMARYWSLLFLLSALFLGALWRAYGAGRGRDFTLALVPLVLGSATHPTFLFPAFGAAVGVSLVRADGAWGWRWPSRVAWARLWGPYAGFLALAFAGLSLAGRDEAVRNWGGRGAAATLRLLPAIVEWTTPVVCAAAVVGVVAMAMASSSEEEEENDEGSGSRLATSTRIASSTRIAVSSSSDARSMRNAAPAWVGRRRWAAMAAGGCLATAALLVAASTRTNVYADYAVAMLPLVFVSAGAAVQAGARRMARGRARFALASAIVLAAAMLPATASHLSDGTRFDYRPALRRAQASAPAVPVATWPVVVAYRYAPGARILPLRTSQVALDAMLASEGDVWVLASVRRHGIVGGDAGTARWLDAHCALDGAWERPRWDYRQYRVELYRCRG